MIPCHMVLWKPTFLPANERWLFGIPPFTWPLEVRMYRLLQKIYFNFMVSRDGEERANGPF